MLYSGITALLYIMKKINRFNLSGHIYALIFVAVIFALFYKVKLTRQNEQSHPYEKITDIINFKDSLEVTIFEETLEIFKPSSPDHKDSLVAALRALQQKHLEQLARPHDSFVFTASSVKKISLMYLNFICTYLLIILLTYYGVQYLALYRFIKYKQNRSSYIEILIRGGFRPVIPSLILAFKAIIKGLIYLILFSPGYVVAYALKTRIDTDSWFFMLILATFTNGLLVLYAQKFFTFLIHEDRKGYVQTARVKNLSESYSKLSFTRSLLHLDKSFKDHVLGHIFLNARYQYLSTINEQASFLITGLVIIEMALNVQNHFSYELLQHLLYKNNLIALLMVFAIFFLVKLTEITTDYMRYMAKKRIRNE